jgi:hypothetical protein
MELILRGITGLVRIMLAAVLLLARAALGFPVAFQPSSPTVHDVSAMHMEASHSVAVMHPARLDSPPHNANHPMPCCCGSGLCQAPIGVLPALTPVAWPAAPPAGFAQRAVTATPGIGGLPAVPPPRI